MASLLSTVRALLALLPDGSKRFVVAYSAGQALLAVLDVVALGLLALLLPVAVGGDRELAVALPGIGSTVSTGQLIALISVVSVLLIAKSLASLLLVRWGVVRFAEHEVDVADRLVRAYLSASWSYRLRASSAKAVRVVDESLNQSFNGFLMPFTSLVAEFASLTAVGLVILVAAWQTAVLAAGYFAVVAVLLYAVIARRAAAAGRTATATSTETIRIVQESFAATKDIAVLGRGEQLAQVARGVRTRSARARGLAFFYSVGPRYVLEAALLGGFLLVGGVAVLTQGVEAAVSALGLFAVAGFRVVPSLTRLQSVLATMHAHEPNALEVLEALRETGAAAAVLPLPTRREGIEDPLPAGAVDISLHGVGFAYPGSDRPALRGVDLHVPAGARVALVGRSGSGKSTLVDLVLGLHTPTEGELLVGGRPLREVLEAWRSRIGYVPQDVALLDASVARNVALSWRDEDVDQERVRRALRSAQLLDVVAQLPEGLDAQVGERGVRLSGGQRQRLGMARALYTDPHVLVLDEATSALDASTEAGVMQTVAALHSDVTVLVVAHRLATVRDCDVVVLLEDGAVAAVGTFDEVVAAVPDFAEQAVLSGLARPSGR
ncbi:ABC-type multidrug transport system fused ATPase/permease subunit [Kineococcus xinjiangensis]|uniref:ABC-type multidrug transport system fused ATPase/permease subunit n=1 Tax=Kineococcus xinjiangensis TaxID=512762 RepID=A0A2S6ITZ7_9ACTN|nr:ABC transporter ATP-binding protein [Kineococcus xinjiangensis]PPK97722.1 ABC-type multidrug transport system fused ATPase/permease subunit [Kineococcus xinjiangensis]